MDYTQREFFYNVIGGFRGGAEGAAAPPFVGACPRTPLGFRAYGVSFHSRRNC